MPAKTLQTFNPFSGGEMTNDISPNENLPLDQFDQSCPAESRYSSNLYVFYFQQCLNGDEDALILLGIILNDWQIPC